MNALDVIAHNIAIANTTGFRGQHEHFSSVLAAASDGESGMPVHYGVLGATDIDLSQGAIEKTGNDLDVAIDGSGFFSVQSADGIRYTRDGSFHVNNEGTL